MEKLIVAGIALVILIIYFIVRKARGKSDFESDQLKSCALILIIPVIAFVIFFICLLHCAR